MQHLLAVALLFGAAPAKDIPTPERAVEAVYNDLGQIAVQDAAAELHHKGALERGAKSFYTGPSAPYMRYLWVTTRGPEYDEFLLVLMGHLNLLSREGDFCRPTLITPDVVRIDVRELKWHKTEGPLQSWEKLAAKSVIFHARVQLLQDLTVDQYWPGGPDKNDKQYDRGKYPVDRKKGRVFDSFDETLHLVKVKEKCLQLRKWSYSEAPLVHAEQFFVASARQLSIRNKEEGTGYYDFLALKTRDDFFKLAGVKVQDAKERYKVWRAAILKSGISKQNRQVVNFDERAWGTLDTFDESGRGILLNNLREGEFKHDAEEWYAKLPNGLWVTFLSDANGKRVAFAPPEIGPDDSELNKVRAKDGTQRDVRVHTNLSCIRCHGPDAKGLKSLDDWVRNKFRAGKVYQLQDPNKEVALELKREYLRNIDRMLEKDRDDYEFYLSEATKSLAHPKGVTQAKFAKMYAEAWRRYVDDGVTLETAANELGTTKERLRGVLRAQTEQNKRQGYVDAGRGGLLNSLLNLVDDESIPRLYWEDGYQFCALLVMGVQPPEALEKIKPIGLEKKK